MDSTIELGAMPARQYIMSDLERWRQLFREEAQRCVQELRDVVEDGRGPAAPCPACIRVAILMRNIVLLLVSVVDIPYSLGKIQ